MTFAQKDFELAWLHYEVGHCYLEEHDYELATSSAEKALARATDANDNGWRLNSLVLLAQIQSKWLCRSESSGLVQD